MALHRVIREVSPTGHYQRATSLSRHRASSSVLSIQMLERQLAEVINRGSAALTKIKVKLMMLVVRPLIIRARNQAQFVAGLAIRASKQQKWLR